MVMIENLSRGVNLPDKSENPAFPTWKGSYCKSCKAVHNDHRCHRFLRIWFISSCHSTSSSFIYHNGTSFKAELHQRACNCCRRLSDVSVFLLYAFGRYSLGSSRDLTEVRPVITAGGWLAHLPEPCAESLETDLGTVIKLLCIDILIQNNCRRMRHSSFYCTLVLPPFYMNIDMQKLFFSQ